MTLMRYNAIHWHHRAALLSPLLLLVFALPVFASLGGNVSTVESDQAHMRASAQVTRATNYTVHEMKAAGGTAVREFVSPSGQVFGVAWNGPFRPDLQQVLGNYYPQVLTSAKSRRSGHNTPVNIEENGVVIQMSGHQRHFTGRAYVTSMLPQGVQTTVVK